MADLAEAEEKLQRELAGLDERLAKTTPKRGASRLGSPGFGKVGAGFRGGGLAATAPLPGTAPPTGDRPRGTTPPLTPSPQRGPGGKSHATPETSVTPALSGAHASAFGAGAALAAVAEAALAASGLAGRAGSPGAKERPPAPTNWVHAPGRSHLRIEKPTEIPPSSADEGWARWLRCSADTDAGDERRVERLEWLSKRNQGKAEKLPGAPPSRVAQTADTNQKERASVISLAPSTGQIEVEFAKAICEMMLPCHAASSGGGQSAAALAAGGGGAAKPGRRPEALRSLRAAFERARPTVGVAPAPKI